MRKRTLVAQETFQCLFLRMRTLVAQKAFRVQGSGIRVWGLGVPWWRIRRSKEVASATILWLVQ